MSLLKRCLLLLGAMGLISQALAAPEPLQLTVYNPGSEAIFPVSSVLVSGERDAVLVDAQFGTGQARQLLEKIRASGKNLTTIYISHGDPDYYFGLEPLVQAFPKARVVASAPTVAHIRQTMEGKLAYWGPKMGADKPSTLIVPQVLEGDTLQLEGRDLKIMGLDGPQPDRSYVWIDSLKAVVGGVVLAQNLHVWMADTQTPESQHAWLNTLTQIEQLQPNIVVPGHYLGDSSQGLQSAGFTAAYIHAFQEEAAKPGNSATMIAAMKKRYPTLGEVSSLELSAKVAKGEMSW